MKKMMLVLAVMLASPAAFADSKDDIGAKNCEKTRADIVSKDGTCPDQVTAAKAAPCKNLDDFNGMTKILKACVQAAGATPTGSPAASESPCEKSKKNVQWIGARHDCPDEMAETDKIACTDNVKDTKRLSELADACMKKPKKAK